MAEIVKYIFDSPKIEGKAIKHVFINVSNNIDLPIYYGKNIYLPSEGADENFFFRNLKQDFSEGKVSIQWRNAGKEWKGKKYPKTGMLLSEYNKIPPPTDPIPYSISGTTVDQDTLEPLEGVKLKESRKNKTSTNSKGEFTIGGDYLWKKPLDLTANLKKYNKVKLSLKTQEGYVKEGPIIIKLKNNRKAIEDAKLKAKEFTKSQVQKIKDFNMKDFIQSLKDKIIPEIKVRLIPMIFALLVKFGIPKYVLDAVLAAVIGGDPNIDPLQIVSDLQKRGIIPPTEELMSTCPGTIEGLNELIKKKNQLTKQLNNIYDSLKQISDALKIPEKIIDVGKIAIPPIDATLKVLSFIPSTSFTPIPTGPLFTLKDLIFDFQKFILQSGQEIIGGLFSMNFLLDELKKVLALLSILDMLIQACADKLMGKEEIVDCTLPTGQVVQMTETQCLAAGGLFGDLILCTLPNGVIQQMTPVDCLSAGGSIISLSNFNPSIFVNLVPCTLPDGTIQFMTQAACLAAGGLCCGLIHCTLPDGSIEPMTLEACLAAGGTPGNLVDCILPDGSIQQMTPEACLAAGGTYGDVATQIQISQELLDSTQNQSQQLSPVVTNVNGFEMGVETEITDKPLKRRRAIAKNKEGVSMLKGEYSYSSNDQILIDELVFYIQMNNLKAE